MQELEKQPLLDLLLLIYGKQKKVLYLWHQLEEQLKLCLTILEEWLLRFIKKYIFQKGKSGAIKFVLQPNKHKKTIFIVDEASMIPDIAGESKLFENGSLLDDLMQYVYSGHQCKLLLVGDTAQLPPVKLDLSPALNDKQISLIIIKKF